MMESFTPGERETLAGSVHTLILTLLYLCNFIFSWKQPSNYSYFLFSPDAGQSDSQSRNLPTLVKDISGVGQVACGSSHTIAVAQDGRTVWSFGGGDNGGLADDVQSE